MRWYLCISLLLSSMLFLSACGNDNRNESAKDNIAFINFEKVMSKHSVYPAWKAAKENTLATEKLKEHHINMVASQTKIIEKMETLGQMGRNSFLEADYAIKISEIQLSEREWLEEKRRVEKKSLENDLKEKIASVENEYKIPIFNLKTNIEAIKPLARTPEELNAKKEPLIKELKELQDEKQRKIDDIYKSYDNLLAEKMKVYEEESLRKIKTFAEGLKNDLVSYDVEKRGLSEERLSKLEPAFEKTLMNIEQQLTEQRLLQEKLYNQILNDIKSVVTQIAMQKKYTVVFSKIELNISATDITDEIIEGLKKK